MSTTTIARTQSSDPAAVSLTSWVGAAPFRAHADRLLLETGVSVRVLALALDVPPQMLQSLMAGRCGKPVRTIRRVDALRIFNSSAQSIRARMRTQVVRRRATSAVCLLAGELSNWDEVSQVTGVSGPTLQAIVASKPCPQIAVWRCLAAAQERALLD